MNTSRPRLPLTSGAISSNLSLLLSLSTLMASSVTLFLYSLVVLVHRLMTRAVSVSEALTIVSLMFWWIGASTVHMKRVPMLMPSAPRHNAAARPWPSANPPEAMNGTLSDWRARLNRMKFVISDSPTCLRRRVSECRASKPAYEAV